MERETTGENLHKTWTLVGKRNLKRKTESLLIAAQNNVIGSNYIKAKINNMQQNGKCTLCGDKDKMINPIISECS